jgi:hypothetical protein
MQATLIAHSASAADLCNRTSCAPSTVCENSQCLFTTGTCNYTSLSTNRTCTTTDGLAGVCSRYLDDKNNTRTACSGRVPLLWLQHLFERQRHGASLNRCSTTVAATLAAKHAESSCSMQRVAALRAKEDGCSSATVPAHSLLTRCC